MKGLMKVLQELGKANKVEIQEFILENKEDDNIMENTLNWYNSKDKKTLESLKEWIETDRIAMDL